MTGGVAEASKPLDPKLVEAHRALRADGDVQFDMGRTPPPPRPPQWLVDFEHWLERVLKPVGRFFRWISSFMPDAPYARIFLWGVIACCALLLLWIVYDRVRHGIWRLPKWRRAQAAMPVELEEEWTPDAAPARAWLKEADALAADGRYADAVHHLLLRSVEDLGRRRPQVLRPSLTSRDLANMPSIPSAPRKLFMQIAEVVERSLFGGRPVDQDEWTQCRAAYTDFAQSRIWAR